MNTSCSRDFCVFFGRIYKNHSAELAAQQGGFDSEGSHFCNLIDLYLFFLGKSGVFQRLDIIQNLRRFGRADQNARHDPVTQDPAERHFGQRLSAVDCKLVEGVDLVQTFFCQILRVQEPSVGFDTAVLWNSMQIPVCQHPLRQRAERDDALLQPGGALLQAVLLNRPVKDGIAVLIDDEWAAQLVQNFAGFLTH